MSVSCATWRFSTRPRKPPTTTSPAWLPPAARARSRPLNFVDDERHWTKAIVGVEGGQGDSVSAELSFCAATVATDSGLLSLPDAAKSDCWRSHPFVVGPPHIGFYAGASIVVSGQPVGVVCVFGDTARDIGEQEETALQALARQTSAHLELRKRNAELRALAVSDPLTGLANRTLLLNHLDLAIAQRRRNGGEVGVLFCDVDDFKLVNDRSGHEAGDRLLCRIADDLRLATRDTDTVARFAGDEFVIVCPGLDTPERLTGILERVLHAVETSGVADGSVARMSIGSALVEDGDTTSDAVRRADEAMYRRKSEKTAGAAA